MRRFSLSGLLVAICRAGSIDLLTANNPAFRRFYALPGDRAAKSGPVGRS